MPQPKPSSAKRAAGRAASRSAAERDDELRSSLAALREVLAGGVMLSARRLQDAVDDAVRRGRMTRRDAEELVQGLLESGRRQTQDLLSDLEGVASRGRPDADLVGRARRAAGLASGGGGSAFPIEGYDELTAAEVTERLAGLDASQLRKVSEHERRNANRKSVLRAVDRALA